MVVTRRRGRARAPRGDARRSDHVWPFFALAFLTGVASAFGAPAGRALTPSLVPQEILVSALAQRSIAFQISHVVGPRDRGHPFRNQPELVYAVSAALSLIALGCVLALRSGREPAAEGAVGMDEVLAGVRLIRRTNVLFGAISLDLFAVLLGGAVALLPIFAKDILEVGPTGLGFLRTAPAIGAFIAALAIARRPIRRRAGPTMFLVVAGFGACMVVFGLSRAMWLSMLALALGGAFDMVSVVLRSTILPLVTPDELRGRVNAVEMVFISGSNELGAFESGAAAALIGAVPAVVFGGLATSSSRGSGGGYSRRLRGSTVWTTCDPSASRLAEQSSSSDVADRRVDELERVERRQGLPHSAERLRHLDETSGIRARVRLRARSEHMSRFAVAELAGCLGLDDVVDPGRAAAEVLFCGLDDLEPGNARERRVRREGKPLRVAKMARVL